MLVTAAGCDLQHLDAGWRWDEGGGERWGRGGDRSVGVRGGGSRLWGTKEKASGTKRGEE